MKIVRNNNHYNISSDDIETMEKIPVGVYELISPADHVFYLERKKDFKLTESKIYGVHTEKVEKVLSAYGEFERNLGVILSGDKGIGKSVYTKLLAMEAMKKEMPVILINANYRGLSRFIESIDQETVVIFDEFDKFFGRYGANELLTLMDGTRSGKKLYVITCNKLENLNEFMIGRPGRFHYHLRFGYPSAEAVREYMMDKLKPEYTGKIDGVVALAKNNKINYDCLRAIAFELNRGLSLNEAMEDLNIEVYMGDEDDDEFDDEFGDEFDDDRGDTVFDLESMLSSVR